MCAHTDVLPPAYYLVISQVLLKGAEHHKGYLKYLSRLVKINCTPDAGTIASVSGLCNFPSTIERDMTSFRALYIESTIMIGYKVAEANFGRHSRNKRGACMMRSRQELKRKGSGVWLALADMRAGCFEFK